MSAEPTLSTAPAAEIDALSCRLVPERAIVRVVPAGTLDLATVEVLEEQMREAVDAGFHDVILDLSELEFMDSTGLRLVLRWDAAARSDGINFAVAPGSPRIQRLFELTGTAGHVPFVEPG